MREVLGGQTGGMMGEIIVFSFFFIIVINIIMT